MMTTMVIIMVMISMVMISVAVGDDLFGEVYCMFGCKIDLCYTSGMIYVVMDKEISRVCIKATGVLCRPLLIYIPGIQGMFTPKTIMLPYYLWRQACHHAKPSINVTRHPIALFICTILQIKVTWINYRLIMLTEVFLDRLNERA